MTFCNCKNERSGQANGLGRELRSMVSPDQRKHEAIISNIAKIAQETKTSGLNALIEEIHDTLSGDSVQITSFQPGKRATTLYGNFIPYGEVRESFKVIVDTIFELEEAT